MLVRALVTTVWRYSSIRKGDMIELPDGDARRWVQRGLAEFLQPPADAPTPAPLAEAAPIAEVAVVEDTVETVVEPEPEIAPVVEEITYLQTADALKLPSKQRRRAKASEDTDTLAVAPAPIADEAPDAPLDKGDLNV